MAGPLAIACALDRLDVDKTTPIVMANGMTPMAIGVMSRAPSIATSLWLLSTRGSRR
jgi:hypothetical protein